MDIKKLEIKKLISEFNYINSDISYKSEFTKSIDSNFLESVDDFLLSHPELKTIFDDKVKIKEDLESIVESKKDIISNKEEDVKVFIGDQKIKGMYRSIVKLTHPDKINNTYLNNIYLDTLSYYKKNDLLSIIEICEKLSIPYDLDDAEIELIKNKINSIKEMSTFLESTFAWQWHKNENDIMKKSIILSYIKSQIID